MAATVLILVIQDCICSAFLTRGNKQGLLSPAHDFKGIDMNREWIFCCGQRSDDETNYRRGREACFPPTDRNQEGYHSEYPHGGRDRERGREKEGETGRERDWQWGGFSIWDKRKLQLEHRAGSPEG